MATRTGNVERLRVLYELGCAFGAQLELEELIRTVVERCRTLLASEGASVLLRDEATDELYFPYVSEADPGVASRLAKLRFPADQGIAGAVLSDGRSRRTPQASDEPEHYAGVDRSTGMTTRAMVAVPLRTRRGVIGVLEVINPLDGGAFDDADVDFLEALAGSVAIAIDNARMHGELKQREERLRSEIGTLRRDRARRDRFDEIIGQSAAIREVFRLMESAAASPIAVLIQGETGTGKELVARGIHNASDRADGPFVPVNIAALSGDLLESELFGHVRGAFTGAARDRRGLFEAAAAGTIFLDEVGELPPSTQVKLLRVLQESEVTPVGSNDPRRVDIRVIAATNRDLRAAMAGGAFREDLYYRLAAFPLPLPALRDRRDDIALLADHFVDGAARRHAKNVPGIETSVFRAFATYAWPGNVRQLENEIERAVALTPRGELITAQSLSPELTALAGARGAAAAGRGVGQVGRRESQPAGHAVGSPAISSEVGHDDDIEPLRIARARFEASYLEAALSANGGNVSRTAAALGMSRVTLHKKMKDYGLVT